MRQSSFMIRHWNLLAWRTKLKS